ncbi:alpha/beta fold hydrolase [Erythrobacter arachoides]|uniref:Alpha/beta fold hydrolase n=1 Tax=Aurantiacibacter arachoides TaxID=1850444 RepID=A0A845A3M0_9SPHN|nr:alpha/beta hydrolase [Aurantiacibacter arachoides]MXO94022.1 alpha/beta fold hydrolase [Aurantiacibacter arachoides]GGD44694.1 hydrolase [Aurantiacibacter arachoides]
MTIHHTRAGRGKPLLLVHGLGGSTHSWDTIAPALAQERELIAIDLPGHGRTPAERDSGTFAGLARSLDEWLAAEGLSGIDMVGSSMGARLVLEMARRGHAGAVVALDPGGFWKGWERTFFRTTISASIALVRTLQPALPAIAGNGAGRTALMAQLSARPWALDPAIVVQELRSFARTPTFNALVKDLATGPAQQGPAATNAPVVIGWGRKDRLCLPRQAERAMAAFPGATLHWFDSSGHFPMWDQPLETIRVILDATE